MTCIKAQAMITPFINNKLTIKELEEFLEHVNSCDGCREELEVYYALLTAMKQLDEDKNLSSNYSQELVDKLEKSHEKVIHVKYTYYRKKVMLIFTMIFLAILISLSYANRSVKEEITESDFHIRILFREPRNDFTDNQLQQYMLERGLEQNPPQ
jgi:hypothetical protein